MALVAGCVLVPVHAADLAKLAQTETALERSALRGDGPALAPLVAQVEAEASAAPADAALQYERAFAWYAQAGVARSEGRNDQAVQCLETALKLLEGINGPGWAPEVAGFRGYLMNQIIGLNGLAAAGTYGPQSSSLLSKAKAESPENPRIQFFNGVVLVTTPELFGGSLKGGIGALEKAVELYRSPQKNPLPAWGEAEALAWLGLAKQKAGDLTGAKAAWNRALAIEPNYAWIKLVLLPAAEKAAPAGKRG